jgi:hypothetical protein
VSQNGVGEGLWMFYERLIWLEGRSDSEGIPDKEGAAAISGGERDILGSAGEQAQG